MLRASHLVVAYGSVVAVDGVSIEVHAGTCTALIGANGSGKTSTLRAIGGLVRPGQRSAIWLGDRKIDRVKAESRARLGLGHVLEGRHIFPNLSVRQNLNLGMIVFRPDKRLARDRLDAVITLFPEIASMLDTPAAALSGGQQQFLAIARALIAQPKVLLLDEPSTGLAPRLIFRLGEILQDILRAGTSLLLAEQSLELVRQTAKVVHILQHGRIAFTCAGSDPNLDEAARRIYLG